MLRAALAAACATLCLPAAAMAARPPATKPLPERSGWKAYLETPAQKVVRPVRVLQVAGDVRSPNALVTPSTADATTLTNAGGTTPSLVLDYGKDVGGFVTFDVVAATTSIQTTYSETLRNMGNDGALSVTLFQSGNGDRTDTFTPSGAGVVRSQYISGGERYEKVTLTRPGSATLRTAGIEFTSNRARPTGRFLSSDRLLNRIWYAGAYTLNLNEMTPGTLTTGSQFDDLHLLMDGAKRDRADWSGDQVIAGLTDFYMSDPIYERESLQLLLDHPASTAANLVPAAGVMSQPGPFPGACTTNPLAGHLCVTWSASYSVALIPALYDYYLYTGDLAFLRDHWPAVARQMAWDETKVDAHGLFAVSGRETNSWNLENIAGELTYVNALYVDALKDAATIADALGRKDQARQWRADAAKVKAAVNRRLWNPRTGVYDGSDGERGSIVQDANVGAILAGIAGRGRARAILGVLARKLASRYGPFTVASPAPAGRNRWISPYMGGFQLFAQFENGQAADALRLMRREWGYMIGRDPGGVVWERIQPDGTLAPGNIADSAAHAWSTGPTSALSRYVLGVAPLRPGYARWSVAPMLGDLRWAQGVVPTPRGRISVRWTRSARRSLTLTVIAPKGTRGTVVVPLLGARRALYRNGRLVWRAGRPAPGVRARRNGDAVLFDASGGTATYAW